MIWLSFCFSFFFIYQSFCSIVFEWVILWCWGIFRNIYMEACCINCWSDKMTKNKKRRRLTTLCCAWVALSCFEKKEIWNTNFILSRVLIHHSSDVFNFIENTECSTINLCHFPTTFFLKKHSYIGHDSPSVHVPWYETTSLRSKIQYRNKKFRDSWNRAGYAFQ